METQNNSELKEFFVSHLKTLYWAEQKLVDKLPDMAEASSSPQLKQAFMNHLNETREHVNRIEEVFNIIGEEPAVEKCKILDSIADAGDKTIRKTEDGTGVRDAGLIFGGQLAEHYEIASYGNMIELANVLGYNDVAEIFSKTLAEEKSADEMLTQIGEQSVNYSAVATTEV